jgi:acyl carrier protein
MNELERQIATLIIEELRLDVAVDSIDPAAPLYGEGLGLDSIDLLEIALVVSQRYGVQLRSDDVENKHIFSSLGALANYVAQARAR